MKKKNKKSVWSAETEELKEHVELMGEKLLELIENIKKPKEDVLIINKQKLLDAIDEARTGYDDAIKEAKAGLLPYEHVEKLLIKLSAFNWIIEISEENE